MGRKSTHKIGDINGQLKILNIIPSNRQGQHVKLLCLCINCNTEKTINGGHFRKLISCGCLQRDSSSWKHIGPKTMPWQLPKGQAAKNNLKKQYENSAKKRNLEFLLTDDEFYDIVGDNCTYCNQKNTQVIKGQGKTSGNFVYTGIDRIDSSVGYTKENCIACCWKCNDMKKNRTVYDFLSHIEVIYKHQHKEFVNV